MFFGIKCRSASVNLIHSLTTKDERLSSLQIFIVIAWYLTVEGLCRGFYSRYRLYIFFIDLLISLFFFKHNKKKQNKKHMSDSLITDIVFGHN